MQFGRPPRALRRPGVHLDNLAVLRVSLLPFKEQRQGIANGLPEGGVLMILPPANTPLRGRSLTRWLPCFKLVATRSPPLRPNGSPSFIKGYEGGGFYVNEHGAVFAFLRQGDAWEYTYLGQRDLDR